MLASCKKSFTTTFLVVFQMLLALGLHAQSGNSSSIAGTVVDPTGAVVVNARVEIRNPVSGFDRSTLTDSTGRFAFLSVPLNPYHLTVAAKGFTPYVQDVNLKSAVPVTLTVNLTVSGSSVQVNVEATAEDLLENTPTFHTDIDEKIIERLPLESMSSSVSSLVTLASPGVAADSNGLFHGMGDHAENSFSVDGQPITDQQSKVFSNQIPLDSIASMEVISGAPPPEYGDKTSLVIDVTTRSGLGITTPHGAVTASYGSFGTSNVGFNFSYGGKKWGNFISVGGLDTGRFLDPPQFTVMHDKGNQENVFDHVDFQLSGKDTIHTNLQFTRSWFQTPNSFDQQNATAWSGVVVDNGGLGPYGLPVGPTDQRSQIKTLNIAPSWNHLFGTTTLFTLGGYLRRDQYNYYPSADPFADLAPSLQDESIGQNRTLTNAGIRSDLSYAKGVHNLKVGITYQQTFLNEHDSLGIVNPTLNAVCLNGDGSPNTSPGVTNPGQCAGLGGTVNPGFNPLLLPYDLTRNGGALFLFNGHTDVKELAIYFQDAITMGPWSFNVGIRGDFYNGLTTHREAEPRLGIAYKINKTNTILRISYARLLETPFNENLVLSSVGCSNAVLNPLLGCSSSSLTPLSPGWRNEFHAGFQQAAGKYLVISAEYIWKYTHHGYDFSVLGATPITFPVEWDRSKIPGYAARISVPNFHGFSALAVFSSVAARFFTPQVGGAGATPSAPSGVFRIDHDERFNETTHLQYQPWKRGPWVGFNWRYDSGLVAGPVPCAGGDCANGPLGSSTVVDASIISPDQQFQAGLFCGSVHATPTTPISSSLGPNLCPASQYGSTLISIPAPGTENDDHNPPRVKPRNLFDVSVGDDNLFHGDKYKWSAQFTIINLTNKYSLYNFLSTFSGTHYVTPRSLTAEIGVHF